MEQKFFLIKNTLETKWKKSKKKKWCKIEMICE